jgi:hypothetical protein
MAGIQIGSVSVGVVLSMQGAPEKLRVQLLPEADKLGADFGEHFRVAAESRLKDLNVGVKADTRVASTELDAIKRKADEVGAKKETIKVDVNNAAGIRGWLTSLIAGAVAIAPAFAVAATGVAAFAALAAPQLAGVLKYEQDLASGTAAGALKAQTAWAGLSAQQRQMVFGITGLKTQFKALSDSIAPEVLTVFQAGLTQIEKILPIITPLAKAGGTALAGLVTQVGGAFTDSQGKQFFDFVQHNLGPDVQAIGQLMVQLIRLFFNLVEALQPVSLGLIHVVGAVADFVSWLSKVSPILTAVIVLAIALYKPMKAIVELEIGAKLAAAAAGIATFVAATEGATIAEKGLFTAQVALEAISPVGWILLAVAALGTLAFVLSKTGTSSDQFFSAIQKQNDAVGFNVKGLYAYNVALHQTNVATDLARTTAGRYAGEALTYGNIQATVTKKQQEASDSAVNLNQNLNTLQLQTGLNQAGAIRYALAAGVTAKQLEGTGKASQDAWKKLDAYGSTVNSTTGMTNLLTASITQLTNAMQKNVIAVLTLQGDDIAWKQAQQAATKQLDSNSAGLAGNSANALANKQAVLQSTNQVVTFAQDQLTLHGNLRKASDEIQNQITYLQKHGDKSKFAAAEIRALRTEEALIKSQISSEIKVTGHGSWLVVSPGGGLPGGIAGRSPSAAAGRYITQGTGPTADDVLLRVSKGELVVPTSIVNSGAVDHLKGMIPGYAGGGVAGSFDGNPKALGNWAFGEWKDSIHAIQVSVADATFAGIKAAKAAAGGGGFGVPGPGGGAPGANAALARRMFPNEDFASWNYVAMRESGWNQFARNPSSGAYGIPQALPPSKMGPAANPPQSNPAAQISWMVGYMDSRYGGAGGAAAHERAFNWYDQGGWLPPGGFGFNGTSKPEAVFSGQQLEMLAGGHGGEMELSGYDRNLLRRLITAAEHAPGETGAAVADELSGLGRLSQHRAMHSAQ